MMKKITRIAALLAATALLFGAIGCSDDDGDGSGYVPAPEPEQGESTSYDFADLTEADFATLGVTVTGSNDIKIATPNTADTPYMVLGGKVGIVTTAASKLSVKPKNDAPVAIGFNTNGLNQTANNTTAVGATVTIDHFITYPVEAGKKYQLAITSGGQANNTAHYFVVTDTAGKILASKACSSSTTDAVTLDAFDATEAVIRLTVHRSNSSGTSYVGKVTITEINTVVAVESVTVNGDVHELTAGEKTTLTATVSPDNATDKTVTWSVTGEDGTTTTTAATVTDGVVTAGSVTANTVVKVFAKAGEKTSAAYSITIKPKAVVEGEATVTYFADSANATEYSAAGKSSDESVVTAKDIEIAWGSDVTSQFTQSDTGIYTTNSVTGYGIQSEKINTTAEDGVKFDFAQDGNEIVTVKVTLTPVKNFTVQKISGKFVNGKSGNTVLSINGTDSGLAKSKTLTLENYTPATAIKGTAGQDLTITFAIKASGKMNVTSKNFQWTQVMNDIEIVVVAD